MVDHRDILREAQSREWNSIEELNAWLAARMDGYNRQPLAELGGVSPEQAHRLTSGDWTTTGPLRLNGEIPLTTLGRARFLRNARTFLAEVDDAGGVKATEAGNLNRKFVGQMLDRLEFDPEYLADVRRMNKVINEEDVNDLHILRVILSVARLLKKRSGRFTVTRNGRAMLPEEKAGTLYRDLFYTFYRRFNLAYLGNWDNPALQYGVPIVLFRLSSAARKWTPVRRLAETTLHEDALYPDPTWPNAGPFQYYDRIIQPLVEFGLLERRRTGRLSEIDAIHVRKLPLYDRFLRFQF